MTIRLKVLDAGTVTRAPGATLHHPGSPYSWTTGWVLDPLGPAPAGPTVGELHEAADRALAAGDTSEALRIADLLERRAAPGWTRIRDLCAPVGVGGAL